MWSQWRSGTMAAAVRPVATRLVAVLAVAFLGAAAAQALVPVRSKGVFTDREGKAHAWNINYSNTLIWEDKPFVPVGGLFQARSWSPSATDEDFAGDVAALAVLKERGVTDVYVQPARGGLSGVRPDRIQKLADHLDAEGFTYGISLNDGPREPLIGYLVKPGAYRQEVPEEGGVLRFPIGDLSSARYFVVSSSSADVLDEGEATLVAEGARLNLAPRTGAPVTFLIPEKIYLPGGSLRMPNVWEGFDNYRDTLLGIFSKVKFGPGFRFFVDPLPADMGYSDDFERFVPTGEGFAREWATWLGRRYKTIESLSQAWSLSEREVIDFKQASKIVPLWGGGKGIQFFYDRTTKTRHKTQSARSAFWADLNAFKAESVRTYMSDLAIVLKKAVADVPVVYRSRGYSPLFTKIPAQFGFDGVGIEAYGKGSELATRTAAYIYGQASDAAKTIWLPVIATADVAPGRPKQEKGYASRFALHSDLDWLREVGARGFYVTGLRVTDPARQVYDLSDAPDQLGWLRDYATILGTTGIRSPAVAEQQRPKVIFYPRFQVASLSPVPLKSGGWWLPTDRPGQVFNFGASGYAYSLDEPGQGIVYYLWNPAGARRIRIRIPKAARDKGATPVAWSSNAEGSVKKDVLSVTVGPEPIRILNLPSLPIPMDAYEETKEEAKKLVKLAREQKRIDAGRLEQELGLQKVREENLYGSLTDLQAFVDRTSYLLRPYLWVEAEAASNHSFDEVDDVYGASGGRALLVGTRPAGDANAAVARFAVNVSDSRPVYVWVAASPNADISLRIDGQPLIDEATLPEAAGNSFADGKLVWIRLGVATIPRGVHTLEMRADGPARIDALLLIRDDFTPNGPNPPPVIPVAAERRAESGKD